MPNGFSSAQEQPPINPKEIERIQRLSNEILMNRQPRTVYSPQSPLSATIPLIDLQSVPPEKDVSVLFDESGPAVRLPDAVQGVLARAGLYPDAVYLRKGEGHHSYLWRTGQSIQGGFEVLSWPVMLKFNQMMDDVLNRHRALCSAEFITEKGAPYRIANTAFARAKAYCVGDVQGTDLQVILFFADDYRFYTLFAQGKIQHKERLDDIADQLLYGIEQDAKHPKFLEGYYEE